MELWPWLLIDSPLQQLQAYRGTNALKPCRLQTDNMVLIHHVHK